MMGAFAEFERSFLRERQREGIARQRGAYRGRKRFLTADQITDLKRRIAAGAPAVGRNGRLLRPSGVVRNHSRPTGLCNCAPGNSCRDVEQTWGR
jgi:DNA invertase Pin-like site-specific DNA recombinase